MRSLFACCLLLLCAFPAQAQQDDHSRDPDLPDIAPREVEVRGKLEISFPALKRPPLTGLLPQASLSPLPPLPVPGVQEIDPATAPPQTLGGAAEQPSGFAEAAPPRKGLLEAGGGRYLSRFARARLDLPLASHWSLRSRLDYDGTDGFQPFDDEATETPSDDLKASATLHTEQDAFDASLTGHGFLGQHQLYGAERSSASAVQTALQAHPSRERYGGGGVLRLHAGSHVAATARYGGAQVKTDVFDAAENRFEKSEQRVGGSFRAHTTLGDGLRVEAEARASTAHLSGKTSRFTNAFFDGTASFLDGGAGVWLFQGKPYRLFAGARLLTFSGERSDGTYVAPDLRLEWQAAPQLTLYARTDPGAEANRLADRYGENPSLLYEEAPQPLLRTLDAEGGLRFFPHRALEVRAFAGYRRAPSHLFYEGASYEGAGQAPATRPQPLYARGVTAARYGKARILRAGGSVSLRHAEWLNASLSVALRRGRLAGGDADLPYFAPVTAGALVSYGFAQNKGRLQATGSFESARPVDRTGDDEVGAFVDLDVEGSYAVTPTLGVVVRLENLSAGTLERYDRYPRPPLVFETGLRLHL